MLTAHEYLTCVLVDGFLGVSCVRHVFDDDGVVWLIFGVSGVIQKRVVEYIFNALGFWDLFGFELFLRVQVFAVIIAQMIVGHAWFWLYSCTGQEIDEGSLEFGLACLEIIADQNAFLDLCILQSFDEGVLRRSVDEHTPFLDRSNGEDGRWSNFRMAFFDGLDDIIISIINSLKL